jgi:hypothetical protein
MKPGADVARDVLGGGFSDCDGRNTASDGKR